jgi:hypothetical protein
VYILAPKIFGCKILLAHFKGGIQGFNLLYRAISESICKVVNYPQWYFDMRQKELQYILAPKIFRCEILLADFQGGKQGFNLP